MMLNDFSAGYYQASMNIQRYNDGPCISLDLYNFINTEMYSKPQDNVIIRLDLNGGQMVAVGAESAIPRDVLALPQEFLDDEGFTDIYFLKPTYFDAIGDYYG